MSNIEILDENKKLDVAEVKHQFEKVNQLVTEVMKLNVDYGAIPGTGREKVLLKPGAEKLAFLFRLSPIFKVEREGEIGEHITYTVICELKNQSDQISGSGTGLCSTLEKKYRYRNSSKCPECDAENTVIRGKKEFGGGWFCWEKKGGCGATLTNQPVLSKIENTDIAETYNTVLKMAQKRAFVAAILVSTGCSNIFTQDVEDFDTLTENKVNNNYSYNKETSTSSNSTQRSSVLYAGGGVATQKQVEYIKSLLKSEDKIQHLLKYYKKTSLSSLTIKDAGDAITKIKTQKETVNV